jgi:hypothetical protein
MNFAVKIAPYSRQISTFFNHISLSGLGSIYAKSPKVIDCSTMHSQVSKLSCRSHFTASYKYRSLLICKFLTIFLMIFGIFSMFNYASSSLAADI